MVAESATPTVARVAKTTRVVVVDQGEEKDDNGAQRATRADMVGEPQVLQARAFGAVDPALRRIVDTATVYRGTEPVGSFRYSIFTYPGDVDIFEEVRGCCTMARATDDLARRVRAVVRRVLAAAPDMYFADFKAGIDERFVPKRSDEGTPLLADVDKVDGGWTALRARYDANALREALDALRDAKLLSSDEAAALRALVVDSVDIDEQRYRALYDAWRQYWVVRWTAREIEILYKTLRGDRGLWLADALAQPTTVKLDAWARLGDRWIEVTNFFDVSVVDAAGAELSHYSPPLGNYRLNLRKDVHKYACKNAMKAAKRYFMERVAAYRERPSAATRAELEALAPLFSSNLAHMSQMAADAETLAAMADALGARVPLRTTMRNVLALDKVLNDALRAEGAAHKAREVERHVNIVHSAYALAVAANEHASNNAEALARRSMYAETLQREMDNVRAVVMPIIHAKSAEYLARSGVTAPLCARR